MVASIHVYWHNFIIKRQAVFGRSRITVMKVLGLIPCDGSPFFTTLGLSTQLHVGSSSKTGRRFVHGLLLPCISTAFLDFDLELEAVVTSPLKYKFGSCGLIFHFTLNKYDIFQLFSCRPYCQRWFPLRIRLCKRSFQCDDQHGVLRRWFPPPQQTSQCYSSRKFEWKSFRSLVLDLHRLSELNWELRQGCLFRRISFVNCKNSSRTGVGLQSLISHDLDSFSNNSFYRPSLTILGE